MSLDLEVWSVEATSSEHLPEPGAWQSHGAGWVFRQEGWQVVVGAATEIDPDDIPDEIGPRLVGIRYFTHVALEPGHAGKAAEVFHKKIGRALAKLCRGVLYDPQSGEVHGAARSFIPVLTKSTEPVAVLQLSWWFKDGLLLRRDGVNELVSYFLRHFPPFAPRRYGDCEPPKFRFDPENMDHFADMALSTWPIFVWSARSLFYVSFSPTYGPGWRRLAIGDGYCIPHLSLQCPAEFLSDPGLYRGLRTCWGSVTRLVKPMYGDVRVLHGYLRRGNRFVTIAGDPPDPHPVMGPWRGLPQQLGLAIALGEPYLDLWPNMKTHCVEETLAMATLPDWRIPGSVSDVVGRPPKGLCQRSLCHSSAVFS